MSKLKVVVGSTNNVKVDAIKAVFKDYVVSGINANSGVSNQPMSDEETIEGAINRAFEAKKNGDVGIGLEGGVSHNKYGVLVISYGALVDQNNKLYIAGGTRIPLPDEISSQLSHHHELGELMDAYSHKQHVKHDEGAVGIFTSNVVKRQAIFEHIGHLLLGQMITGKNNINR